MKLSIKKKKQSEPQKTPRRQKNPVSWKERLISASFLAPSLIGVMAFFILPFLVVIYYSMIDNPINPSFVFLQNFVNVLNNTAFQKAASNTLQFSLVAVPLAVLLSLGLALLLNSKIPFRSQFRTFFLSPMMVPVASVVLIWQVLFHYNGVVNDFLGNFGVQAIDWLKSEHGKIVLVLLFLWKNLGYNMILFMAALGNIPQDILEVARLDTSSAAQIFVRIKIRYLSPTLLFVTIFSLINSFKVFREIYLLTNDYPYDSVYMLQHFMNNTFDNLDYQKLSAAAIIMAVVIVVLIGILFVAEDRFGKDVEG
jgi:multiple sugar transport system permease protein